MRKFIASAAILLLLPGFVLADEGRKSAEEKFSRYDKDKDGKISSAEYHEKMTEKFTRYDKDKDGYLSKEEFEMKHEEKKDKKKDK